MKGEFYAGERLTCELDKSQVETIKHGKQALGLPYTELAKIYNVHPSTIFLSLKKYAWPD